MGLHGVGQILFALLPPPVALFLAHSHICQSFYVHMCTVHQPATIPKSKWDQTIGGWSVLEAVITWIYEQYWNCIFVYPFVVTIRFVALACHSRANHERSSADTFCKSRIITPLSIKRIRSTVAVLFDLLLRPNARQKPSNKFTNYGVSWTSIVRTRHSVLMPHSIITQYIRHSFSKMQQKTTSNIHVLQTPCKKLLSVRRNLSVKRRRIQEHARR